MNSAEEALLQKNELKRRGISPFVAKAIARNPIPESAMILDIPCGYGRHATWLADFGHKVVAADIAADRILSFTSLMDTVADGKCRGVVVDAHELLPFPQKMFDAVLIIDFVSASLLSRIASYVKPEGVLIYQTMSGRGENWRELPLAGSSLEILTKDFDILEYSVRGAGPSKTEAETVAVVGRRKRSK